MNWIKELRTRIDENAIDLVRKEVAKWEIGFFLIEICSVLALFTPYIELTFG